MKFDCQECIAQNRKNRIRGKLCLFEGSIEGLKYQIGETEKIIQIEEDFERGIEELGEQYKTDKIELLLHKFYREVYGICEKSYSLTLQTLLWLELVDFCTGGMSLVLPDPNVGFYDTPAIFFDIVRIVTEERRRYNDENKPEGTL